MNPPQLTAEQKRAIFEILRGQGAALFVAVSPDQTASPQRLGLPDGTHCIVPPTYADVSGNPTSVRDLFDDLQTSDLAVTIYDLASLNVLLDRFATDFGFQRAAVEKYVRPELRNPPQPELTAARPNYEFIINTLGSMIALKGAIGIERRIAPILPSPFKTGDLILRANRFVSGTRFDGTVADQSDADLAAETMCTWDLTNPRDLGYEPARVSRMLELLDSSDEKVTALREKLGIVRSELRFAGLPIVDFLAIVFGLFSVLRNVAPDQVLRSPPLATINSSTLLANVGIPQATLDTFLANRSLTLAQLRDRLAGDHPWTADEYAGLMESSKFRTDFLLFRQFPLIAMSPTEYLVPNLQFLSELMFSGLFFELYFGFPPNKRELFASLWGRVFELSIFEELNHFYPPMSGFLRTNIEFSGGEIDAMLDFGDYILIFELKHFLLTHDVKYSRNGALLEATLRERLFANQKGKPKGIQQLVSAASAIRSGEVKTNRGRTIALPGPAVIYPVIVVADPVLETPFVNVFCNKLFQETAGEMDMPGLTIMSVHELDETLPIIASGQLTWQELLNYRFERKQLVPTSVGQARYMLAQQKNLTYVRNEFRLAQFEQLFAQMRAVYSGTPSFDAAPEDTGISCKLSSTDRPGTDRQF